MTQLIWAPVWILPCWLAEAIWKKWQFLFRNKVTTLCSRPVRKKKDPIFFASHSCWDLAAAEMSKVKQFVSQWKELHAALRSKSFVNVTTSSFLHPTQCSSTVFCNMVKVFLKSFWGLIEVFCECHHHVQFPTSNSMQLYRLPQWNQSLF